MGRKLFCFGVVGLLSTFALPKSTAAAEKKARFAVVEVKDETEKVSYHVMNAREAQKWVQNRLRAGDRARAEWKELPSNERKQTPEPERVKVKVKKSSVKSEEEAKAYAEKLIAKVPADERAREEAMTERKGKAKGKAREKKGKPEPMKEK